MCKLVGHRKGHSLHTALTVTGWIIAMALTVTLPAFTYHLGLQAGLKRGYSEGLLAASQATQNEGRQREQNDGK